MDNRKTVLAAKARKQQTTGMIVTYSHGKLLQGQERREALLSGLEHGKSQAGMLFGIAGVPTVVAGAVRTSQQPLPKVQVPQAAGM